MGKDNYLHTTLCSLLIFILYSFSSISIIYLLLSQVTLTSQLGVEATSDLLPVNYENFHQMACPGDTIYVSE